MYPVLPYSCLSVFFFGFWCKNRPPPIISPPLNKMTPTGGEDLLEITGDYGKVNSIHVAIIPVIIALLPPIIEFKPDEIAGPKENHNEHGER